MQSDYCRVVYAMEHMAFMCLFGYVKRDCLGIGSGLPPQSRLRFTDFMSAFVTAWEMDYR